MAVLTRFKFIQESWIILEYSIAQICYLFKNVVRGQITWQLVLSSMEWNQSLVSGHGKLHFFQMDGLFVVELWYIHTGW